MPRATKIVATLGPASSSVEVLERLIVAGVDVVRMNFSHGTAEDHINRAALVRELRQAGFVRIRVNGAMYEVAEEQTFPRSAPADFELVVDRLVVKSGVARRLADSLETATRVSKV